MSRNSVTPGCGASRGLVAGNDPRCWSWSPLDSVTHLIGDATPDQADEQEGDEEERQSLRPGVRLGQFVELPSHGSLPVS